MNDLRFNCCRMLVASCSSSGTAAAQQVAARLAGFLNRGTAAEMDLTWLTKIDTPISDRSSEIWIL